MPDENQERLAELEDKRTRFEVLASIFLTLPTLQTIQELAALDAQAFGDDTTSLLLAEAVSEAAEGDAEEMLEAIAKERVKFVRGTGMGLIMPPYESLYVGEQQNSIVGSLNRFYSECGFKKLDDVHDTADQLGVECAFAALLLTQEQEQLLAGDADGAAVTETLLQSFMSQHLARWAEAYGDAVLECAQTAYWRAVASLIKDAVAPYRPAMSNVEK